MHLLHLCINLLMLVNKNTVDHCLLMLVHSAFTNVKKHNCDFINALLNVEINIKINKCCRSIVHS